LAPSFTQLDLNLDELRYWLIKQALIQPLQTLVPFVTTVWGILYGSRHQGRTAGVRQLEHDPV
jgi:hypothetical protein